MLNFNYAVNNKRCCSNYKYKPYQIGNEIF